MIRKQCRICNGESVELLLDFGKQPIVHHLQYEPNVEVPLYPFELGVCTECLFLQLLQPIDPDILYQNYFTLSSWKNQPHAKRLIEVMKALAGLCESCSILEVGCNDGSFMQMLLDEGVQDLIGVEPTKDSNQIAQSLELKIINDFFGPHLLSELGNNRFDLVISRQVLEHVIDLHDFLSTIRQVLKDDGTLVIEIPDSQWNLEQLDYALWEEHVNYFTLNTAKQLLSRNGFKVIHHEVTLFSGRALTIFAEKTESSEMKWKNDNEVQLIQNYQNKFDYVRDSFRDALSKKNNVYIYGCGARSSTFLNFLQPPNVVGFVDDQSEKQLHYLPNTNIQILPYDKADKNAFFLLGVNTENESKVVKKRGLNSENFYSILPPSKNLPNFWKNLIL